MTFLQTGRDSFDEDGEKARSGLDGFLGRAPLTFPERPEVLLLLNFHYTEIDFPNTSLIYFLSETPS